MWDRSQHPNFSHCFLPLEILIPRIVHFVLTIYELKYRVINAPTPELMHLTFNVYNFKFLVFFLAQMGRQEVKVYEK